MYLGPLTFSEIFKPMPWGGRLLGRVAGKKLPPGTPVGESWEVCDYSIAMDGPAQGMTLQELTRREPMSLLGRRGVKRFPLMVKLIDAQKWLSVQVHPDDECARQMRLKFPGKTEAWYVLRAKPGAALIAGLTSARDIPRLRELARSGELADRLERMEPKTGEALLCEAGAVHALGPGVVVLEVQQSSEVTFRLFDWRRVGLDGKPRELHVEQAIRAIGKRALRVRRSAPRPLGKLPWKAERLVRCDKFVMDRWEVSGAQSRAKTERFEILHVARGTCRIDDGSSTLTLRKGATALLPACVREYGICPRPGVELIRMAEPE